MTVHPHAQLSRTLASRPTTPSSITRAFTNTTLIAGPGVLAASTYPPLPCFPIQKECRVGVALPSAGEGLVSHSAPSYPVRLNQSLRRLVDWASGLKTSLPLRRITVADHELSSGIPVVLDVALLTSGSPSEISARPLESLRFYLMITDITRCS
ncbi:hypothetical protein BO71DRAFT_146101 [Aspergillus ellipticus CBS 707.79]|uniref:Uncharacterized protein n=1 Tax=Aspergillus ellipticus CBS 707.79 TaxID=1448320 RepID=A0A319EYX7_9EURO|nr:hypothetical protein BO71DRAFT_146101 [Aspergillus ellipticus CBS 707.79]